MEDSIIIPKDRIIYIGRNFHYEQRVLKIEFMHTERRSFVSIRDDRGAEITTHVLSGVSEDEQRTQYQQYFANLRRCTLEIDDNGLVSRFVTL